MALTTATVTSTAGIVFTGGRARVLMISNDGAVTASLAFNQSTTVTPTNGMPLAAGDTYEWPAHYYGTNHLPVVTAVTATGTTTLAFQTIS